MAQAPSNPTDARRAEMEASIKELDVMIQGLDIESASPSLSHEGKVAVNESNSFLRARRSLEQAVLAALDAEDAAWAALVAHGYPELPKTKATPEVIAELEEEDDAVTAARGTFEEILPASTIKVVAPPIVTKPEFL